MATPTLVFHSCHFNSRLLVTKQTNIKTPWLTDETVATATSSTCWKNSITTSSFRVKTTSGTIIETERKKKTSVGVVEISRTFGWVLLLDLLKQLGLFFFLRALLIYINRGGKTGFGSCLLKCTQHFLRCTFFATWPIYGSKKNSRYGFVIQSIKKAHKHTHLATQDSLMPCMHLLKPKDVQYTQKDGKHVSLHILRAHL